jgi:ribose transport system permease protein
VSTNPTTAVREGAGRQLGSRHSGRRNFRGIAESNGPLIGLLLLVLLLFILTPDFLTTSNLLNVGVQVAAVAILAFGQTFVVISGGIDLSVGSVAALAAVATGWAFNTGLSGWLALLVGLGFGIVGGLLSGLLVAFGRLPAFIATLAVLSAARGLTLVISDGVPTPMPDQVGALGQNVGTYVPVPVLIMLGAFAVAAFILRKTYAGRAMYAIGGNREAAVFSGINVKRQTLVVYILSGLFAAVAGLILAGRLSSAQPTAATGYELDAIAAVVIGGASLSGGTGRAVGTLIGALILAVIRNGLNLLQVSSFWQQVVIGCVIALAALTDTLLRRRSLN